MVLKQGTPVNEKSIAKLGSVSVVSEPALLVSTGANDAPRVAPGQIIASQETVSLDEIAGKLAVVTDNANGLITQVKGELDNISGDAQRLLLTLNSVTSDERPNVACKLPPRAPMKISGNTNVETMRAGSRRNLSRSRCEMARMAVTSLIALRPVP